MQEKQLKIDILLGYGEIKDTDKILLKEVKCDYQGLLENLKEKLSALKSPYKFDKTLPLFEFFKQTKNSLKNWILGSKNKFQYLKRSLTFRYNMDNKTYSQVLKALERASDDPFVKALND